MVTSQNAAPNTGEPYSANADNYLMDAQVNDMVVVSGEKGEQVVITAKTRLDANNIQYTVARGWGGTKASAYPAGTALRFESAGTTDRGNPAIVQHDGGGICMWRYMDDPHGTDTTSTSNWGSVYLGHEAGRLNRVIWGPSVAESPQGTLAFYEGYGGTISYNIAKAPWFGGKYAPYDGLTQQSYPNYSQLAAPAAEKEWHTDLQSFIGGNLISCYSGDSGSPNCSSSTCDPNVDSSDPKHCAAMRVNGASCSATTPSTCNTYRYLIRDRSGDGLQDTLDRKFYPTFGVCGTEYLHDVSGPGSVIDDSVSSAFCVAQEAGECRPESQPGYVYVRCEGVQKFYSASGEGFTGVIDVSLNDFPATSSAVTLFGFAPDKEGVAHYPSTTAKERGFGHSRILTQMLVPLRTGISTAKALPNGKWILFPATGVERWDLWVAKVPPFQEKDSTDRTTFVQLNQQLTPPAGIGVENAVIEFGYAENGPPEKTYCTSRAEKCLAVSGTIPADPFRFPSEATDGTDRTIAGQPCASGCNIMIPALPQHVVYYRVSYRDSSNQVVAQSPLQAYAVP